MLASAFVLYTFQSGYSHSTLEPFLDMPPIRTLDLSKLASMSQQDCDVLANQLVESFSTQGMVKLKNAPIEDGIIERAFDMSRKFFQLPLEEKTAIAHPEKANPNRGWVRAGQEKTYNISGIEKGKGRGGGPAVLNIKVGIFNQIEVHL